MARHVLLNNSDHKDVRIDSGRSAALGDAVMYALVVPSEFRRVQAHYPIVFARDANEQLQPVALFGFRTGQNLFLTESGWDAPVLPLMIERQPFAIGTQGQELKIHLDLDSPRVRASGDAGGEELFLQFGGTSAYLDRIKDILLALHQSLPQVPVFMGLLQEYQLLESFLLDFPLPDGTQQRVGGFHTLHEERVAALDGAALQRFHQAGLLEALFMVLASTGRFSDLIQRFHRQHGHHL